METRLVSLSRATGIFSDVAEGVVEGVVEGGGGVCTCSVDKCGNFRAETGTVDEGSADAATTSGEGVATVTALDATVGCPDATPATGWACSFT